MVGEFDDDRYDVPIDNVPPFRYFSIFSVWNPKVRARLVRSGAITILHDPEEVMG